MLNGSIKYVQCVYQLVGRVERRGTAAATQCLHISQCVSLAQLDNYTNSGWGALYIIFLDLTPSLEGDTDAVVFGLFILNVLL